MNRLLSQIAAVLLAGVLWAAATFAGTVSGTIHNGTNNKPGAGLDVIIFQLQGGMQELTTVKSDAQGHYLLDRPEIGSGPMLIRVVYRGVNYHQPLPPGTSTVDIEVFEPTSDPSSVSVSQHDIVVQPSGTNLLVGEEFAIENKTQPPVAFFKEDGTFNFVLPEGAQLNQVSAWSAAGMPVVQGTIDKGKNRSSIAFPFRPGKNGVRISYQLPYPSNKATLKLVSPYAVPGLFLVAPPTLQINAAGFNPGGNQDGYTIYGHDAVAANAPVEIAISGTAPPPPANAGGGGGPADDSGNPSVNSRAGGAAEAVNTFPARLDSLKWILVAGFAALFALGIVYLWRRPQMAIAGNGAALQASAPPPTAKAPSQHASNSVVATVDREVSGSLDELKEKIFRLELRHQAGTISDEEYSRQRAQVEQTLRNLVRG
ncbi:MAG: hypothetical protein WB995_08915 [Candidatus Acidiferrales bacterium]